AVQLEPCSTHPCVLCLEFPPSWFPGRSGENSERALAQPAPYRNTASSPHMGNGGGLVSSPTADPDNRRGRFMQLTSLDFNPGGPIPSRFTCEGDNVSPELSWKEAPADTKSFALIVHD